MAGQRFVVRGEQYELGGHVGDGAVGLVRKATRLKDKALQAVKFLAPDPKYIEESVFDDVSARFRREGERGTNLRHPHLITVYDYCHNADGECFESDDPKNPFLLMEYVHGRPLENYIRKLASEQKKGVKEFNVTRRRLHIGIQIANALDELHRMKLVHRDVKPANVFLSKMSREGNYPFAKLGDFGIVKWGDFHASLSTGMLTATNQRGLGTMKYMSPEQAIAPKDVTVRSDIYSFGITLFELFTTQILASPHHVFEVMNARLSRGTTTSRFHQMGYRLRDQDEHIAGILLEMHLRGASGRPTIDKVRGHLESEYERRYDSNWEDDLLANVESRFEDSWDE